MGDPFLESGNNRWTVISPDELYVEVEPGVMTPVLMFVQIPPGLTAEIEWFDNVEENRDKEGLEPRQMIVGSVSFKLRDGE